jgi:hypothetical protein
VGKQQTALTPIGNTECALDWPFGRLRIGQPPS